MSPARFAVLAILLAARPAAGSSIESARVVPDKPTTDDPVTVVFSGRFPDRCPRSIRASVEEPPFGDTRYAVTLEVIPAEPPGPCLDVLTPFTAEVDLGFPSLGMPFTVDAVLVEGDLRTEFPDIASFQVELGEKRGIAGITTVPARPTGDEVLTLTAHGVAFGCGVMLTGGDNPQVEVDGAGRIVRVTLGITDLPHECFVAFAQQYRGSVGLGPLPAGTWSVDVDLAETMPDGTVAVTGYPGAGSFEVAPGAGSIRGDSNGDGTVDLSDPICTLGFLFLGQAPPPCLDAADADDSGSLDITDAVYTLEFLFLGGPPSPAPVPGCG